MEDYYFLLFNQAPNLVHRILQRGLNNVGDGGCVHPNDGVWNKSGGKNNGSVGNNGVEPYAHGFGGNNGVEPYTHCFVRNNGGVGNNGVGFSLDTLNIYNYLNKYSITWWTYCPELPAAMGLCWEQQWCWKQWCRVCPR
ncbi:hypothetical protein Adt_44576 [Abeliophyllum distichum]|uniref:Uncharacterized protein n=1 Tax=Abeliophyllum distichum TaxID=126358 RepID=A0ABD1PEX2_9LAMI